MNETAKFAKVIWGLIEEWGPEALSFVQEIVLSLADTGAVTFCGICGTECPVHKIVVDGKEILRGKCPEHGFKR